MKPIHILLVDDDEADVLLTRRALQRDKLLLEVHEVQNGEDCMAFLRKQPPYEDAPRPDIVLLDLNMPRMGGLEVLEAVRADPELRFLPIVILTTSSSDEDIVRSYNLNANCYITKPVNLSEFKRVIESIEHFWFTVVRLPTSAG